MKCRFILIAVMGFMLKDIKSQVDTSIISTVILNDSLVEYIEYFNKNKKEVRIRGFLVNGNKDSIWNYYYKNGVVQMTTIWKNHSIWNVEKQNTKKK